MNKSLVTVILLFILSFSQIFAQCKVGNYAFQAGEQLKYDIYFKYGLIDKKAGVATLATTSQKYNGVDAYKMNFVIASTGFIRKLFALNDTLVSYTTTDIVPLAFAKNAHEGKEYTQDNISYAYDKGVKIQSKRIRNGKQLFDESITSTNCVYDMINVIYYARILDFAKMKVGDVYSMTVMSGKDKVSMQMQYKGLEDIKANNEKTYSCIKVVLSIIDTDNHVFDNKKEAMKVYLTNDSSRMPIRLDTKLKVGYTRAILSSYAGNRYPVKAKD